MPTPAIRLDKSKPFSECRGDRTPEDPHYRVAFWQGQRVNNAIILLPFDSQGELVPDDGKNEPWDGLDSEQKKCRYYPLYTKAMRDLVERKQKRAADLNAKAEPEASQTSNDDDDGNEAATEEVNFVSYLRGEARYEWPLLQAAAKKRFSRFFTSKKQLVEDLVLDEKIVPVDQLCADFAKLLPAMAA